MSASINQQALDQYKDVVKYERIRRLEQDWSDELHNPNGFDYMKLNEIRAKINKLKED